MGTLRVLCETDNISVAVFSTFSACTLGGPDAPAWGQGLARPRNSLMRLRSAVHRKVVWWFSSDFREAVNTVRQRYGLPRLQVTVTELAGQMPLYLMPSTPAFDYQRRDLPPSVQYVGPCCWDKPSHESSPEWLDGLSDGSPVVHVTEATIQRHEPFLLRAASRRLGDLPVQVIMTSTASQKSC